MSEQSVSDSDVSGNGAETVSYTHLDVYKRQLLNKISFGHLYNDTTLDIKIHANDTKEGVNKVSGVSKYYYYIDQIRCV